jgi:hypothetical protein
MAAFVGTIYRQSIRPAWNLASFVTLVCWVGYFIYEQTLAATRAIIFFFDGMTRDPDPVVQGMGLLGFSLAVALVFGTMQLLVNEALAPWTRHFLSPFMSARQSKK